MKKILWSIILLITMYGVLVFINPNLAEKIGSFIGIDKYNEQIRNIGKQINKISIDILTQKEFEKTYSETIDKVKNAKDILVEGIEKTKDKIDNLRVTLSGAEETLNKAKDLYVEGTETINKIKKTLDNVENVGNSINNIVGTGTVN